MATNEHEALAHTTTLVNPAVAASSASSTILTPLPPIQQNPSSTHSVLSESTPPSYSSQPPAKKPRQKKRKEADTSVGSAPVAELSFPEVEDFMADRGQWFEIRGKTLTAFNSGGNVFKVQRGKNAIDLLAKFEAWLVESNFNRGGGHQM